MPRCYMSGVDVTWDDTFVLDVSAARRALRDLRARLAVLDRLVGQLGAVDPTPGVSKGGRPFTRRDRRLVSRDLAMSLGSCCPERELFLPWSVWRARGRCLPLLMLQDDPDYGGLVQSLPRAEMDHVVSLAEAVSRQLFGPAKSTHELRNALLAGVCLVLRRCPAEEIVATVLDRLKRGAPLEDLGIPPRACRSLVEALESRGNR